VQEVNQILNVRGQVLPTTFESALLVAHMADGSQIRGESQLSKERQGRTVARMALEPAEVRSPPEVPQAIADADVIVIGPGSLFTSLIPALLVPEVASAICRSSAPLIYIANLFSEAGETDGLDLEAHHHMLEQHLGRAADLILVNTTPINLETLNRYRSEGADLLSEEGSSEPFRSRVRHAELVKENGGQHCPDLLAEALMKQIVKPKWWKGSRG
jgi:uncharacterized cofD-like protein